MNSSVAARIRSKTSTIRPGQGTRSPAGWPVISPRRERDADFADLRRAMIYGSVLASFNVEAFSLERLRSLTMDEVAERYQVFKAMSAFEDLSLTSA